MSIMTGWERAPVGLFHVVVADAARANAARLVLSRLSADRHVGGAAGERLTRVGLRGETNGFPQEQRPL